MRSIFLLDPLGKAFSKNEKILYWLVSAFFISLFLPDAPVVGNIVIGALLTFLFFSISWAEKGRALKDRKEIQWMLVFFLLHIISAAFSDNKREGMDMLVLRLPLLVFPMSLGLYTIREELRDRILLAYCIIVTGMAIACQAFAVWQTRKFHETAFLYDDSLTELIRRQSVYIALMVSLALFSYVYLLTKKTFVIAYRGLAWLNIAFLVFFHFMLASRISIITLYSCLVVFAGINIIRKKKYLEGATLVMGLLIVGVIVIKFAPKTLNRFRELNYTGYTFNSHGVESHYNMKVTADQWNGANIRLAIWKCGWELAREHWLTGVPLGDKRDKLVEVYKAKQFDFAAKSRRNMHNNYLDVLCNFGVAGMVVFLMAYLVLPLLACYRHRDGLGAFIILTFGAAMITETWMDTSLGCILIGFFYSFLSARRKLLVLANPGF